MTFKGRGSVPDASQAETAFGSGFVIDRAGDIVTNEHVVGGAGELLVHLPDGTVTKGRLVGADASVDLAVVRIRVDARRLHPLTLGASAPLALGAPVLAIGTPLGYAGSVSAGVISGFDRAIESPNGSALADAIQTDAAINHGSSGGPLLDSAGRVIGVDAQLAMSGVNGNIGVAFAIPMDAGTRRVIAELRASGTATHAWLGIAGATLDAQLAAALGLPGIRGVLVTAIAPAGPAAGAGIHAGTHVLALDTESYCVGGDVLTELAGRPIASMPALQNVLERYRPGATVTVRIVHIDGVTVTRSLKLATQPAKPPKLAPGC